MARGGMLYDRGCDNGSDGNGDGNMVLYGYDTYGMVECCRYYMSMLIRAGTVR